MSSLRARLLAGVLVLAAGGLVLLGLVTYAEQRSFLLGRVDQEARAAVGSLSHALDLDGFKPGAAPTDSDSDDRPQPGPGGPGAGGVFLPPGTYGQRRLADGRVLGNLPIRFSDSERLASPPAIPAQVPLGRFFTVGSKDGSTQYRVFAGQDPEDSGITVAAVPLTEVNGTLNRLLLVEALVIAGVLAALGLTAFFVVRLGLRPLSRMEVTAGEIAAGELSRRVSPATSNTEVGRLGLALNRMLDRLEQAFAEREASERRLRQFLADASHELRTPLASIRGYAELFRMGATRGAAETTTAMRRIEEESERMGVLVEDLLTLARLDQAPRERRQSVDLVRLAGDAVADARATAPGRSITLRAPAGAIVSGDPHQLQQVVANLMRNALFHTPPDSPIEITVETDAGSVQVRVRDHGPGLPAESEARLFDRFWRAEGGRERGKAGAGLGLAIVAAIVAAHHGRISASNAPDGGAEFVLELPADHPGSPVPQLV